MSVSQSQDAALQPTAPLPSELPTTPAPAAPQPVAAVQTHVNVNVQAPPSTVVIMPQRDNNPSFMVRMVWFLFVGWWLSFWWLIAAWALNATIIGLPLGLMMINRVPTILTLQSGRKQFAVTQQSGVTVVQSVDTAQLPMWIRAIYFLTVGWWASLFVAILAWALSVLILTLPIGLLLFNFLPQITTLRRS